MTTYNAETPTPELIANLRYVDIKLDADKPRTINGQLCDASADRLLKLDILLREINTTVMVHGKMDENTPLHKRILEAILTK